MRYFKMRKYDTANWDGLNTTIFFSGCTLKCPGCFNEEAQDFNSGFEFTKKEEDLFIKWANDTYVTGVCILGGEPFDQDLEDMYRFILRLKTEVKKPIHLWSGYKFEDLLCGKISKDILKLCDTLVDGRFDIDKKNLNLKYRGSSNQRVIDVKETLKNRDMDFKVLNITRIIHII
ncbi:Anaerobic ribonucleoside-triphosphate reductase-activating protein [bioreactor metagenome]|uniref:Anaerobic ribonucleoside-triphosphate reductase-activating protein n=1 Tax=bioreactor metagenome TaxID=1076179 RepID=A0A645D7A4_9ZZZZ